MSKTKKEMSAGGIVYKKEGDQILWLITQHSEHKGWGFPKGLVGDHIENESMETAAVREVREEGGVNTKIVHDTPVKSGYKYKTKDGILVDKTCYYYLMEYLSGDPKDHDWEVSEAKFVTEEEALKILTYETERKAFTEILQLLK